MLPRMALATVLVLAGQVRLEAQVSPCPEFRVNTYTTGLQYGASVAPGANGGFVVVWHSEGQDGSSFGVFGRRYDGAANPLGAEFPVNTYTTGSQRFADVASDAAGNFVVVWSGYDQPDDAHEGIFARRFDAAGVPQGPEFHVNSYTALRQSAPSVASAANGSFVVVWSSSGQDGSGYGVFGQRFDASGVPQGTEFRANTYTTSAQDFPTVASDAAGNFMVVWGDDDRIVPGRRGVFGQRYDAAGVPQGPELAMSSLPVEVTQPVVAANAGGDFVVVWEGTDGDSSGVLGRRFDPAGTPQGPEAVINAYTTGLQFLPDVAADGNGGWVAAWSSVGQDGSLDGIFGRRLSSAGAPQGPEFRLNTYTTDRQRRPSVAAGAAGNFVVTWASYVQDGSSRGVYASAECARYYTVAPCRVADTRGPDGPSGGPPLAADSTRAFPATGLCGIPPDARAVAFNLTAVNPTDPGSLRLFPAGQPVPLASALNFTTGRTRAGNAVVPLGTQGEVSVRCDMPPGSLGNTNLLLDVYGYFKR